ncbi:MFS transporter [Clavibacter michiganensis]|uniref:MFS transporter n=1 Tax=Clavibacter michiganensis TaxID=28447 RepID=UPI000A3B02A5|nr:MFS transporter [Clavibacter michiganensis]MDO4100680.1 MFS transporter [Clavibacter michiganensis]MDO4128106.1 MFS transporter [Clavibacter michiganensis]NIY58978.1 MFS transporter [Clavibacter michiganensis subsp. michiganensis]OUE17788.1 Antiseptic resistance protein [Clavibacter michiganensis subsp. michiganensis]QXP02904.1 MFS transporter [Clavibacter michiganensis subsp. michiganensis]
MSTPTITTTAPPRGYASLRAAAIPLAALCLAFFVEMVDNTLLSIALPTIGRALDSGTTGLQWVTGAYSLTFGGLLLTAGSAADRFGRRRVLLIGLAAFGVISLAVVLVTDIGQLIALRAALGAAAAAMAPVTMSLIFRLFDDEKLRMRSITIVMVVGMSGFVLGPLLGGSILGAVSWQWLLVINAPLALLVWIGVRLGIPADRRDDLTSERLDLPGTVLTVAAIGLGCYTLTSGVERGWLAPVTLACALGAVAAVAGFVLRERRTASPMIDLAIFRAGPVRGAALTQLGASVAFASILFGLILHFQYAYGWSPMRAGLANLPIIVTMIAASPIAERLASRLGHRMACLVGTGFLVGGLVGLAWAVEHGYLAIMASMIVFTVGLRTIMTICAVALVESMPANRTSIGAALNDTAQELGTSLGTAVVGTLIAALVTTALPAGTWSAELVSSFFAGERAAYLVVAVLTGVIATVGALSLSDSRTTEEPAAPEAAHVAA